MSAEAFWFNRAFRAYETLEEISPNHPLLKPERAVKFIRKSETRMDGFCEYAQALIHAIGELHY